MTERLMTRLAVFVVLRNEKQEILLQQRSNTGYLDGYWDLPSGHVEYGESLRESAARETEEEIGVKINPEDLELIHIEQSFVDHNYVNYTFEAKTWSGTPQICEPEKCSAVAWFSVDALPERCVNAVRANEQSGFSSELTYSITDASTYESMLANN